MICTHWQYLITLDNDLHKISRYVEINEENFNRIISRTSLKKETELSSVAATVAFLLSDDSKSITGHSIIVDSGSI